MDGAAQTPEICDYEDFAPIAPKPRLSQKQLHKNAKENTYKFSGGVDICDLNLDENSTAIPDISSDFSLIKRKKSINA